MLYEYNGKIYVRPFSNKIVEVEIEKIENEYNVKATNKVIVITPKIQNEMVEVTLEYAYNKQNKGTKRNLNQI